jgi:signal peptidase I
VQELTRIGIWILVIIAAICTLLYLFVFDTWTVPGSDKLFAASVLPAMKPEDVVLLRRGSTPGYGELARCINPTSPGTFVVGRVFGTAGDRVEVSDFAVITSGKSLAARHGCPEVIVSHPVTEILVNMTCHVAETGAWSFEYLTAPDISSGTFSGIVETGKLYLVSDNRLMHQDSRDYGLVDASTCQHIVYRLTGEKFSDASRRFTILW